MDQKKTERKVLRVSPETLAYVTCYANDHEISLTEAADRLLNTAKSRLAALARYNAKPKKLED